jgi:hypothetical protein
VSQIDDYLAKRAAAVAARDKVMIMSRSLGEAGRSVGGTSGDNWEGLVVPLKRPVSAKMRFRTQAMPTYPTCEQLTVAIAEFYDALSVAIEAYDSIDGSVRSGLVAPPNWGR